MQSVRLFVCQSFLFVLFVLLLLLRDELFNTQTCSEHNHRVVTFYPDLNLHHHVLVFSFVSSRLSLILSVVGFVL